MQVETFECQETASEPIEATEEAIAIMDKLGLTAQRELVSKNEESGRDFRCPYRLITRDEMFVYRTLCPEKTPIEKYKDGPIPLRVLQVAAHAVEVCPSKKLFVFHRAIPQVKDPVLVAFGGMYDWDEKDGYILARWGEELEPFAVLIKRAVEACRDRLVSEAQKCLSAAQSLSFDEMVKEGFNVKVSIS